MPSSFVHLRPQTTSDQPFLFQLFTETHTKKLQLNTLPIDLASTILKQQFDAQATGYQADFPDAQSLIIEQDNKAIGKLVISEDQETTHIIDIAITANKQNQSIGSNLIKSIINKATKDQKSVTLTVDALTGPVALYKRLGFRAVDTSAGSVRMRYRTTA